MTGVFLFAGCLMRVSDAEVRQQIIESVKSFYNCVTPKQLLDGMGGATQPKPQTFCSTNRFYRLSEALSFSVCCLYVLISCISDFFCRASADISRLQVAAAGAQ